MNRSSRFGWKGRVAPRQLSSSPARKRRQWTFEQLEVRHVLSAAGLGDIQWEAISSSTPEGAAEILQREIAWQTLIEQQSTANSVQVVTNSVPNDPLFDRQWHLLNTGQQVGNPDFQEIFGNPGEDINLLPAWDLGYTGAGVIVAVVDSGVQTTHPDLVANIHPTLQFDAIDNDPDPNPNLLLNGNAHGTAVAGLIAAPRNGIGTTGVAPDAQIAGIRLIDPTAFVTSDDFVEMLRFGTDEIDVFNHSWGSGTGRTTNGMTLEETLALRDSIQFGRGGLGTIHVKSSGNSAGPTFSPGFQDIGVWSESNYDGWDNSRYTIVVSGIDHDGFYSNIDGTVTNYPEAGANVLVTAPTASAAAINIGNDTGVGSGIVTTDTVAETGYNRPPLPNGFEDDRDFLEDTDYTSRFGGTSAASPIAAGVVTLMLQANPNLSWRDVQEILVRSSRQAAQFEDLQSGLPYDEKNTWITNRNEIFREPDVYDPSVGGFTSVYRPITDPNLGFPLGFFRGGFFGDDVIDPTANTSTTFDHFYGTPDTLTNGVGYTVSQGRGIFGESIGYGHGVVDAELAVQLAEQWTTKGQTLPDELTFTTFVGQFTDGVINLPAREVGNDDSGNILVPGKVFGDDGFIDFYNEFFVEDDPDDPDDGPFSGDDPPVNTNGVYVPLRVPDTNTMSVESVEVKMSVSGDSNGLDSVRMTLVSPSGTHSELNTHFDIQPGVGAVSVQNDVHSEFSVDPPGTINGGPGNFIWTFNTNRNWGERSDQSLQMDPATGEPYPSPFEGGFTQGWELHMENFSSTPFSLEAIEVIWHGSAVDSESQRLMGLVGVDESRDSIFNFERYTQQHVDFDGDGVINRLGEVERTIDTTQEAFGANATVVVRRTGETEIVDQFVTGADGNFYFDLVPDFYTITVEDGLGRSALDDPNVPEGFLPKYKSEWQITPDYFSAWDHQRVDPAIANFNPATDYDIRLDSSGDPALFVNPMTGGTLPSQVRGINFLLDPGVPTPPAVDVTGFVFNDLDGDGIFGGQDVPQGGIEIFADLDGDGIFDLDTEPATRSLETGTYSLTIPAEFPSTYEIRAIPPTDWTITAPDAGFHTVFGRPGDERGGFDFGLQPSETERQLDVAGLVFVDENGNGIFDGIDTGQFGIQVYADLDQDGIFDQDEPVVTTGVDGTYNLPVNTFTNVDFDVRVVVSADRGITAPPGGFHTINGNPGDVFADRDFGIEPSPVGSGSISGFVFNDQNSNGIQDGNEFGAAGFRVYIDQNRNGSFDAGETETASQASGIFTFLDVAPGFLDVRVDTPTEWSVTAPAGGVEQVPLPESGVVTGLLFGVNNEPDPETGLLTDFGDLGGAFPTLLADDGPWHTVVEGFSLGLAIDGESDGRPTENADGDDLSGVADEDGVQLVNGLGNPFDSLGNPIVLTPGMNLVEVTVLGLGGLLNAWMDFNGNESFDAGEQVFDDLDLRPGTYVLPFTVPSVPADGESVAARFRWGEAGLGVTGGSFFAGEVEDYELPTTLSDNANASPVAGDYNADLAVTKADYEMWKSTFGSTTQLQADGNGDGTVNLADYTLWQDSMHEPPQGGGSSSLAGGAALASSASASVAAGAGDAVDPVQRVFDLSAQLGLEVVTIQAGGSTRYILSVATPSVASAAVVDTASLESLTSDATQGSPTLAPIASLVSSAFALSDFDVVDETIVADTANPLASAAATDAFALMDYIFSRLENSTDDESDADSLFQRRDDHDEEPSELALAAALDDSFAWWN